MASDIAGLTILTVFDEKERQKGGKRIMASIRKANPMERYLRALNGPTPDLVLIVDAEVWQKLEEKQQLALLDHELCHVDVEEKDTGETVIRMRAHDVEEFAAVVRRHGAWKQDLVLFNQAQMDLFDGGDSSEGSEDTPEPAHSEDDQEPLQEAAASS